MCGLCGILFERRRRTARERAHLLDIFTRLLVLSESRGRHASGVGWIRSDGSCGVYKAPMPASELVRQKAYVKAIAAIDNKTTLLMGHTRWRTQGSETNNDNNHPLVLAPEVQDAPTLLLTHNGHVTNADALFRRFGFAREAEVDSEILLHLAAAAVSRGIWDLVHLRRYLARCHGTMTAIFASTAFPRDIIIAKGNKPLSLVYSPCHRVTFYASELSLLAEVLGERDEWEELQLPPMTLALFSGERLVEYREEAFSLSNAAARGRWACR